MAAALRALPGQPVEHARAGSRRARGASRTRAPQVGRLVGAGAEEIVFTSGGTEANKLAIRGLLRGASRRAGFLGDGRPHVVSSRLEHPAVAGALAAEAADVTFVAGRRRRPHRRRRAARGPSPRHRAGDAGARESRAGQRLRRRGAGAVAHEAGALFHTDAVQAAGKLAVDVGALGVDALTLSAHKLHGPKGVGAVYLRRGAPCAARVAGGHQERERRAGTENVAASSASASPRAWPRRSATERRRGGRPAQSAGGAAAGAPRRAPPRRRRAAVPGTLNVGFAGAPGQLVAAALDLEGICVSTGAACTSGIAGAVGGAAGAGAVARRGAGGDAVQDWAGEHRGGD